MQLGCQATMRKENSKVTMPTFTWRIQCLYWLSTKLHPIDLTTRTPQCHYLKPRLLEGIALLELSSYPLNYNPKPNYSKISSEEKIGHLESFLKIVLMINTEEINEKVWILLSLQSSGTEEE